MFRPDRTLTVTNAPAVFAAGLRAIADGQTEIDLGELITIDSSAVATLLAWQRAAREGKKQLIFRNLPANLQSLADLYGTTALLDAAPRHTARTDLPHH